MRVLLPALCCLLCSCFTTTAAAYVSPVFEDEQQHASRPAYPGYEEAARGAPSILPARQEAALSTIEAIEDLNEQIKTLRGEVEQLQHNYLQLEAKLEHIIEEMTALRDTPRQVEAPEKAAGNLSTAEGATTAGLSGPEAEYQAAYTFIREKNYPEAAKRFQAFIEAHPKHAKVSGAYYWLGESHFQKQEYEESAVAYLKGYQAEKKGENAQSNLFKLAQSLRKLSKKKEACIALFKLKKEFPNAKDSIKKKTADEISALKCKEE